MQSRAKKTAICAKYNQTEVTSGRIRRKICFFTNFKMAAYRRFAFSGCFFLVMISIIVRMEHVYSRRRRVQVRRSRDDDVTRQSHDYSGYDPAAAPLLRR